MGSKSNKEGSNSSKSALDRQSGGNHDGGREVYGLSFSIGFLFRCCCCFNEGSPITVASKQTADRKSLFFVFNYQSLLGLVRGCNYRGESNMFHSAHASQFVSCERKKQEYILILICMLILISLLILSSMLL